MRIKQTFFTAAVVVSFAVIGHAQNTGLIKQRAREAATKAGGQPGLPQHGPGTPGQPGAQPLTPEQKAAAAQQQSAGKLTATIAVLRTRPEATPEQTERLNKDLQTYAAASAKTDALTKLANDLGAALPGRKFTSETQAQLARALAVLINIGNAPASDVQAALRSANSALKFAGVPDETLKVLVADMQAVIAEQQKPRAAK
ncbi:MAG: hypothetical protein AB1705_14970 [Verrucomicrobiota bacterium]